MRKLAKKLPCLIKNSLKYTYGLIPLSLRYGKVFWETYNFLQESQWWSHEKLEEYQMQQLSKLLHHAYEDVPYYRRVFDERGLKPKDIQSFDDLKKLPYLSKEIIRKNKKDFISRVHSKRRLEQAHTGGSTGSPLYFWYERRFTSKKEMAFVWRMWNWYGYYWRNKCLVITGSYEMHERIRHDPIDRCLYIYNPNITISKIREYLKLIETFKPKVIRGYPSLIYLFAHFIVQYDIKINWPFLKLVYCASEKIFDFQRKEIQQAFGCKVYEQYGHNERLVFASKCEENNFYHVIPEYGIMESVKEDINFVTEDGKMRQIIGTGFNNYAFPLIRYKTGDWAVLCNEVCRCGRSYPQLKEIVGRSGDFILTPSGKLVSPTVIEFAIRYIENFKDVQIVQTDRDIIESQIVPDDSYTPVEGERFAQGVKDRIGEKMSVKVKLVDEIERPHNQKRRFVKSEISNQLLGYRKSEERRHR